MLEKLFIKNYLIIKEAELSFTKGLNILTGETGAGKSIILDAMGLILGDRADYSIIRNENSKLIVEGHFNFLGNKIVLKFLKEKELFPDGQESQYVIIRRELNKKGISRTFINDTPVNISELKDFGDLIIDIHSQNEHQSLLKKETHCGFLDNFLPNDKNKSAYILKYNEYKEVCNNYSALLKKKDDLLEKKGFIEFQMKEINNINPVEKEDEELSNELNKMENSEDISVSLNNSLDFLYEGETNIIENLSLVTKEIKRAAKYDSGLGRFVAICEECSASLKNITEEIRDYINNINFDPVKIESIRTRLGSLSFLKKKYNLSLSELIEKAKALTEEYNLTENFDFEIEKLSQEIEIKKTELIKLAEPLSADRNKSGKELEKKVNAYFKEVGLDSAEFKINFDNYLADGVDNFCFKKGNKLIRLTSRGIDDIEFLIKANKGGDFSPLRKTASGGEISRIMLSLKAAFSGRDNIPILVFDEIDSGISGRIAGKVGKVLSELSKSHQIISITHLPQIAAMSNKHFYIKKSNTNSETVAEIKNLNEEEAINEIARLLSGEKISTASILTAKELRGVNKQNETT